MNLITDPWIPIVRENGDRERIAPWQIAEVENPVLQIMSPRPDFQGALYQFLIGLVQTVFAPKSREEWQRYADSPPIVAELAKAFESVADAFELYNPNGVAFLQDFSLLEEEPKNLAALLIEAPGDKTLSDHLDHFVKGGFVRHACESCTATALFTLQTNAPSGGAGHRVGLRGGGPLTTLLVPDESRSSLWRKLWLNVLLTNEFEGTTLSSRANIFPWLAATRISDKSGAPTLPIDVDPLQMYWGMPRRIRLEAPEGQGECDLCGEPTAHLYRQYRTKNYGVNYEGPWVHPLTPYRFDPKNQQPPLSIKGQQGGLGYRHWLNLIWFDPVSGDTAAKVVQSFLNKKYQAFESLPPVKLWSFGFDMDNMKARCWYEQEMPVVAVQVDDREDFFNLVAQLIAAARDVVKELRSQVKAAWFSRPKDAKGDISMIDQSFWEATEYQFYQQLKALVSQDDFRFMPGDVASTWSSVIKQQAKQLFDDWALQSDAEDLDMKRVIQARRLLSINLSKLNSLKTLYTYAAHNGEVA